LGVGYYPNSSFVHLDIRKGAKAFWIDYSGPGEAPLYSQAPDDDLRSGLADRFRAGQVGEGAAESPETDEGAGPRLRMTSGGPPPQINPHPLSNSVE
jgi:hypothetical protein